MRIYTIQMAKWRLAKRAGLHILDTTVKTGDLKVAPTWDMVLAYKRGELSSDDYQKEYQLILEDSMKEYPDYWEELLQIPNLALLCFCKSGAFCHRVLLKEHLLRWAELKGIVAEDGGELTEDLPHVVRSAMGVFTSLPTPSIK